MKELVHHANADRRGRRVLGAYVKLIRGDVERFEIDEVLVREFLCHFTLEWPRRWVSLPHSREFATRLSNWDLTHTMLKLPWTTGRFWLHECLDLCRSLQSQTSAEL